MYLLGHTDPKFTMRVYQQALDVPSRAVGDLEQLLGCTLDEARDVFSGYAQTGLKRDSAAGRADHVDLSALWTAGETPR